jgi:hypothetical protein
MSLPRLLGALPTFVAAVVAAGLAGVVGSGLAVLPASQPMEKAADSTKAISDAGLLIVGILVDTKRGQLRVRDKAGHAIMGSKF